MMRWATVRTERTSVTSIVQELADGAHAALQGQAVTVAILFVAYSLQADVQALAREMTRALGVPVLGCNAAGLITDGREQEDARGAVLLVGHLPDVGVVPFQVDAVAAAQRSPLDWQQALDLIPEQRPAFVLLADPFFTDVAAMGQAMDAAFPGCVKVGGLSSGGPRPADQRLFLGEDTLTAGVVGLALYGDVRVTPLVAQGAIPLSDWLEVTGAKGQAITSLNGKSVVNALTACLETLTQDQRRLFQESGVVGVVPARDAASVLGPGDYLVRDILGLKRAEDSLMVGTTIKEGDRICVMGRDAASADRELRDLVDRLARHPQTASPRGALLFSCVGRGEQFFETPDHDAVRIRVGLGEPPLAGFFCGGEIGPIRGRTWLHAYTASAALFHPRGWS